MPSNDCPAVFVANHESFMVRLTSVAGCLTDFSVLWCLPSHSLFDVFCCSKYKSS